MVLNPSSSPLADNGGPTKTHGLHHQSAAVNAGEGCDVTVDQRYVPRDTFCDVGAFEFTDFTIVTITIDPTASVKSTGTAVVTGTVRCSRNEQENVGLIVSLAQTKGGARAGVAEHGGPVHDDRPAVERHGRSVERVVHRRERDGHRANERHAGVVQAGDGVAVGEAREEVEGSQAVSALVVIREIAGRPRRRCVGESRVTSARCSRDPASLYSRRRSDPPRALSAGPSEPADR